MLMIIRIFKNMNNTTNLISYKSGSKLITTDVKSAIESYNKNTTRLAAGEWVDKRGHELLTAALAEAGINPETYEVKAADCLKAVAAERKAAKPANKAYRSYSAEIDAAGDINNLLRCNGNAAAAE